MDADTTGVLLIGITARILGVIVVGSIVGLLTGNIFKSVLAATIGILLADVTWIAFLLRTFSIARDDVLELVANPILLLALAACPAVAVESRTRALTIGITLSVILPTLVAGILVLVNSQSGAPGTGLAQALSVIIAALAIAAGIVGTLAARAAVELGSRYSAKARHRRV